jgi:hypothetical protein
VDQTVAHTPTVVFPATAFSAAEGQVVIALIIMAERLALDLAVRPRRVRAISILFHEQNTRLAAIFQPASIGFAFPGQMRPGVNGQPPVDPVAGVGEPPYEQRVWVHLCPERVVSHRGVVALVGFHTYWLQGVIWF